MDALSFAVGLVVGVAFGGAVWIGTIALAELMRGR